MVLGDLAARLEGLLDSSLSAKRAKHSRSVAEYAARLCSRHGLDPLQGRVAGLAHDLCKERGFLEQLALAQIYELRSGRRAPASELLGRALVHGPAAAGLLISELDCDEADILEAVALHTIGGRGIGALAQILYAADKLEPGRRGVDPEFRSRCEALPPPLLFTAVMRDCVEWLCSRGLPVAEETLALYNELSLQESPQ